RTQGIPDLAPIDVAEIAGSLERVGTEVLEDDPKTLRRRIAELERELDQQGSAAVDEEVVVGRIEAAVKQVRDEYGQRLVKVGKSLGDASGDLRAIVGKLDGLRASLADQVVATELVVSPLVAKDSRRKAKRKVPSRELSGPQRRVLDALAWLEGLGIAERASRVQVAFLAGYRPGGGAFANTVGSLRSMGLIEYPATGEISLTDSGREHAECVTEPLTTETLQRRIMDRLNGPQRRVLEPLIAAYPCDVSVEELAQAAGYEVRGGAFNNTRGSLRSLGLIDYPGSGRVIARPVLFVADGLGRA
ncbi:MAG: hypothetical protein OXH63_16385, partial [Gemmatimonadetes bacterium]|nr:hypothetical protein [Gemmatimonadota bacterium]